MHRLYSMGTGDQNVTEALPDGNPAALADQATLKTTLQSCGRSESDLCETDSPFLRIPVEIDVLIPVREFRVSNLLSLEAGHVIASGWPQGEDLPLGARCAQLAWTEFEVIEEKLAVRITRLV
jgi:flagellar motor switch/type III secretory pathway protein FliN